MKIFVAQRASDVLSADSMQLSSWLAEKGIAREEFAREIGVHRTSLYRICIGLGFPKPATIRRIMKATDGSVTADDFMQNDTSRSRSAK